VRNASVFFPVSLSLLGAISLGSCASDRRPSIISDKSTNWLSPCSGSVDCAAGLRCIAGTCTIACESDAQCTPFSAFAVCVDRSVIGACASSETSAPARTCSLRCDATLSCPHGLSCIQGACAAPQTCMADGGALTDAAREATTPPSNPDTSTATVPPTKGDAAKPAPPDASRQSEHPDSATGPDASRDGATIDGSAPGEVLAARSCNGLTSDCGPLGADSCCVSVRVIGGEFKRSYDGVTYNDASFPATVRDFYLDEYEVTVGRFRNFLSAWLGGWRPAPGGGKHAHLPGGALALTSGSTETGWDPSWDALSPDTLQAWDTNLRCDARAATWTPTPGLHERMPIDCITWHEAYAFCIWDGGFLPTEAEWNYAAAGGREQRAYPWSRPATSMTIDCSHANYSSMPVDPGGCGLQPLLTDVGAEPNGNGRFGQGGLAGNVQEWTFDIRADPYSPTCVDCGNDVPVPANTVYYVLRGGAFDAGASLQLASARNAAPANDRSPSIGVRCARSRIKKPSAPDACEDVAEAFARSWDRCSRQSYGAARETFSQALQCTTAMQYDAQSVDQCVAAVGSSDCAAVNGGVFPGVCAGVLPQ
jgi:sulfatase modifying factor 1